MRNGSDNVFPQKVRDLIYIDELVQTALNNNPADAGEDDCRSECHALEDARFNVLGLVASGGESRGWGPEGLACLLTWLGSKPVPLGVMTVQIGTGQK